GRKALLLGGMAALILGQFLLSLSFMAGVTLDEANGGGHSGLELWFAVVGALCVVMGYSASFGPLTWLLTSELFPSTIRGRALGISTIVTYLVASLTTSTFLTFQSWFGSSAVFAFYGIMTLAGMVFVSMAIPDTGGDSVDQIDAKLHELWFWGGRRSRGSTRKSSMVREAAIIPSAGFPELV
ncbi:MAG: MFS transporter, partial [Myxococcota bacterium]